MRSRYTTVLFVLLACFALPAVAQNPCQVSGAGNINFGNYKGSPESDVNGSFTVQCDAGLAYTVGLSAGNSGNTSARVVNCGGGTTLAYWLYSDAAHTQNWGNTSGTGWVAGTATGKKQNITIYGALPANEIATSGGCQDTVTITATMTASGAMANTTETIQVNMQSGCGIGASNLNFGNYVGALINSTTTISITCNTTSTPYNVGLNAGTASGATVTTRKMTGPSGALLSYTLYRDSGHTNNWGNTVGTDTVAGTNPGSLQTLTVYGQLPAGQSSAFGSYSDTITATLTY